MTSTEIIAHNEAISEIRKKVGGWFGSVDLIFAGHPMDEDRAKEARKTAIANNISKTEITEISLKFLHEKNCSKEHIDEQIKKINKFFNKLID